MASKASRREAVKKMKIKEAINEFEVVTKHGNWSELIVKIFNFHRTSEMEMREVLDPKTRALSIKQKANELMALGECLEEIAYYNDRKEEESDENLLESEGDGEGSGTRPF